MYIVKQFCPALVVCGLLVGFASAADTAVDAKPAGKPEFKLPPGWTEADMQACMLAGTPGKMHEHLAQSVGSWQGKSTMWMGPGADPVVSDSSSTCKALMDGRFFQVEVNGEMPGMGPYKGFGLYGFDNVAQKFACTWIDNHGTGMMTGTGDLSSDGKTITWNFMYNCPIAKKPVAMREIETTDGNTKTLEMFGNDPKSGKEYKMMRIELTRK